MNKKRFSTYSIGVFVMIMNLLLPPPASLATPRTWVGATGNWFVAANWTPNDSWPTNGDDATITNGCVILTNTTAALSSLSISNATLVFTNATTNLEAKLLAGNVYVRSSGIVTHTLNTDTNSADGWGVDGRVYIECTNLTVASNGWINADGKGYYGGRNAWGGYNAPGYGPGSTPGSTYGPGGAGHGGAGGKGSATADAGGPAYGTADAPQTPGSGSASYATCDGRDGGGLIRIVATGKVTVDGTITANGLSRSGYYDAGGSGGGISITCNTFEGSGVIRANGGDTWIEPGNLRGGGSGGGGRIAIRYDPAAQAAVNPKPTVLIQANGGTGIGSMSAARRGASGTIYLSDTNFFPTTTFRGGEIVIPGFTNWSVSSLTVTDGWMALPAGFQLTVSNDLTLNAGGGLCLTNAVCGIGKSLLIDGDLNTACFVYNGASSSFTVGSNVYLSLGHLEFRWMLANDARTINVPGSLTITNWGYMYMYSGTDTISRAVLTCAGDFSLQGTFQITSAPTNDPSTNYGALVSVRDMTLVATNSWVYPVSHELNGGSPLFRARNLTISTNAGFNADYRGFSGGNPSLGGDNPPGYGPGRSLGSTYGSGGAGYGGAGGAGSGSAGGGVCGSSNAPVDPGSGSGGSLSYLLGRYGGGLVRIEATETVAVNGTITANGNSYPTPYTPWAGGGSGGGIYITCKKFSGDTNGLLRANGGDGGVDALGGRGGGGGGGGRIAVWRQRDEWHGTAQCSGGLGDPGEYPDGDPGAIVWGQLPVPGTVFVVH